MEKVPSTSKLNNVVIEQLLESISNSDESSEE
jgi:hypothetical protein